MESKTKTNSKDAPNYGGSNAAIGLAIGAGIGLIIGTMTGNVPLWLPMGAIVGLIFGGSWKGLTRKTKSREEAAK